MTDPRPGETAQKRTWSERIDDVVGFFSPERAMRRKTFRQVIRIGASYFQGARKNRLTYNWATGQESADTAIYSDLQILRDRSRDLNRNNSIASGITTTVCVNVIETGITPQSRIDTKNGFIDPDKAKAFQSQAEAIWQKWGPWADASRRLTIDEIQALAVRQILESGEFLATRRALKPERGRPYMLCLDIIEPDRLGGIGAAALDANTRYGITSNEHGEPTVYHILKTHPGDILFPGARAGEVVKVAATDRDGRPNVFHIFPVLRPGQTRGIPFFAPVIEMFKHMADYLEATIVQARIAACFAAFIKTENAYASAFGNTESTDSNAKRLEAFEPGMVEYLRPGESVELAKPEAPATTFAMFTEQLLRMIGASLGLPYELVLKDFSKTNYSSARAAMLQAYRVFKIMQQMIINHLLQPLWELLLEEAWLRGELIAPSFNKYRWNYARCVWIPPGWQWVDPMKEAQANKLSVQMGFKTRGDVCAEQGEDWEEKAEQAAREKEKYEELGLPWEGMGDKAAQPGKPAYQNQGPDGNEEKDNAETE